MTEVLDKTREAKPCGHSWEKRTETGLIFQCALCAVIGFKITDPVSRKAEIVAQKCTVENCKRPAEFLDEGGWI